MAPNQIGRVASLLGLAELSASAASSLFIDRLGKRRGVGLGLIAMTATMALLPLFERWQALAVAGMFVFTIAFEFTIVSNIGLLSDQVPLARGTVLAMAAMAGGVTRTVSDTLGVALFEWRGMQATAAYGVAGAALAVFVLYPLGAGARQRAGAGGRSDRWLIIWQAKARIPVDARLCAWR